MNVVGKEVESNTLDALERSADYIYTCVRTSCDAMQPMLK